MLTWVCNRLFKGSTFSRSLFHLVMVQYSLEHGSLMRVHIGFVYH